MAKQHATWTAVLVLAAIAALTALQACGNEEEEKLTRAEYVTKANAICLKRKKERPIAAKEEGVHYRTATQKELERLIKKRFVPNYESMVEELASVPAPEGEEKAVDQLISSLERAATSARTDLESPAIPEANKLAFADGLDSCTF
jgi:hypothetical protein